MHRSLILLSFFWVCPSILLGAETSHDIPTITIDRRDIAAQQRGAGLYFNYCSGCHSLKQSRYSDIARDLKIVNTEGEIDKKAIFQYLNHVNNDPYSSVLTSLDPAHAQQWLGKLPPDLSLVARSRSPSWIAAFLKGFTLDEKRPWGVNNTIMENTAMPHVLISLQGMTEDGQLKSAHAQEYEQVVHDLVAFLNYVAEPRALEREIMGKYVLLFLGFLTVLTYLYYQSVWADLKNGPEKE